MWRGVTSRTTAGTNTATKGKVMYSVFGLLLIWVAEKLDRNLFSAPDFDDSCRENARAARSGSRS
jgi:hypothetical protein